MSSASPVIVPCGEARFDELVGFVVQHNGDDANHIGYFGGGPADITSELRALTPPPAEGFRLAYDGDRLVGIMGVDADPVIGRAWLYGPLVIHADWQALADQLYAAVQPAIPPGISEHELFCDAANLNCQAFAARHGFFLRNESTTMSVSREQRALPAAEPATEFEPRHYPQFHDLHARLFPRTYYTAQQIVDRRGDLERLLIVARGDELQGYVFFKVDPDAGLGYIDFMGVAEHCRRCGVGTRLLATAVHRMFSRPEVLRISLTVTATNVPALQLYARAGFQRERTLRAYRKQI